MPNKIPKFDYKILGFSLSVPMLPADKIKAKLKYSSIIFKIDYNRSPVSV